MKNQDEENEATQDTAKTSVSSNCWNNSRELQTLTPSYRNAPSSTSWSKQAENSCWHLDHLHPFGPTEIFTPGSPICFPPMALHLWIPSGRSDSVSDFRTISRSGRPRPPFCGDVCHGRTSSKTKIFMMLMKDDERTIVPNPAQIYLFLFKYTWDSFWIAQASNDIHNPQPTSPLRSWGSHGIASPSGDGRIMF